MLKVWGRQVSFRKYLYSSIVRTLHLYTVELQLIEYWLFEFSINRSNNKVKLFCCFFFQWAWKKTTFFSSLCLLQAPLPEKAPNFKKHSTLRSQQRTMLPFQLSCVPIEDKLQCVIGWIHLPVVKHNFIVVYFCHLTEFLLNSFTSRYKYCTKSLSNLINCF